MLAIRYHARIASTSGRRTSAARAFPTTWLSARWRKAASIRTAPSGSRPPGSSTFPSTPRLASPPSPSGAFAFCYFLLFCTPAPGNDFTVRGPFLQVGYVIAAVPPRARRLGMGFAADRVWTTPVMLGRGVRNRKREKERKEPTRAASSKSNTVQILNPLPCCNPGMLLFERSRYTETQKYFGAFNFQGHPVPICPPPHPIKGRPLLSNLTDHHRAFFFFFFFFSSLLFSSLLFSSDKGKAVTLTDHHLAFFFFFFFFFSSLLFSSLLLCLVSPAALHRTHTVSSIFSRTTIAPTQARQPGPRSTTAQSSGTTAPATGPRSRRCGSYPDFFP